MLSVSFALLVASFVVVAENVTKQNPDVIKWQDLKVIMLRTGNFTRGSLPRPQMTAVHRSSVFNSVACIATGEAVNQKENFPRVEWSCFSDEVPLGSKMNVGKVLCECYDLCREDYIVIGSCSLEYTVSSFVCPETSDFHIGLILGAFLCFGVCFFCTAYVVLLSEELLEKEKARLGLPRAPS